MDAFNIMGRRDSLGGDLSLAVRGIEIQMDEIRSDIQVVAGKEDRAKLEIAELDRETGRWRQYNDPDKEMEIDLFVVARLISKDELAFVSELAPGGLQVVPVPEGHPAAVSERAAVLGVDGTVLDPGEIHSGVLRLLDLRPIGPEAMERLVYPCYLKAAVSVSGVGSVTVM